MPLNYIIPLGNFERDTSSAVDLGDAEVVESSTLATELLEFIASEFAKAKALLDLTQPKFYLRMELPESVMETEETRRYPLDRTLTVFKLFKSLVVKSNIVFITSNEGMKSLIWRHYVHWNRLPLTPYTLSHTEDEAFQKFWSAFATIDMSNFAVYRFHLAEIRPYLRDRFTDYVESMEYLLVPDSGEGEIGYKFRTRGALLIGQPSERENTYKSMKKAYDLRSAIVHGDSRHEAELMAGSQWEDKISPVRDFDRQLIVYFFRVGCIGDSDRRRELLLKKTLLT